MNRKLDTDTQVFFYEQDFYVLSNFSAFRIHWRGRDFDTSEAAYHWERFATGQDNGRGPAHGSMACEIADMIRFSKSAHEAFRTAQDHKYLQRPDWDEVKVGVMKRILHAKAEQHEYVRRKLLATGDRELIEDSWRDAFWGWGENQDGENMLGRLWMEVRAELRAAANAAPCQGSFIRSFARYLHVYLEADEPVAQPRGSGIFVRENGAIVEISREEWDRRNPGVEPVRSLGEPDEEDRTLYTRNITHNLNEMAEAAGIYKHLWRPDEVGIKRARQLIEPLSDGLRVLQTQPAKFRELNPANGWGDYEGLVAFVEDYLRACERHPNATVRACR